MAKEHHDHHIGGDGNSHLKNAIDHVAGPKVPDVKELGKLRNHFEQENKKHYYPHAEKRDKGEKVEAFKAPESMKKAQDAYGDAVKVRHEVAGYEKAKKKYGL